ncbi:hypothetical protein PG997_000173 [Apiospora hydei]|uniref:Uncharacterized protein n=1 Tax=Apiospora hydei TaxID=1337664 RepID=A0ABR1X9Z5_9PEZI
MQPLQWMRLPDTYKGLGPVTASDDDHTHTFPINKIAKGPPQQWTQAQCIITNDKFTSKTICEEADYIIVRRNYRVKEMLDWAKEDAKRKNSVVKSIKGKFIAPLIEARAL